MSEEYIPAIIIIVVVLGLAFSAWCILQMRDSDDEKKKP